MKQKIQAANKNCGGGHRHGPCSGQSCWNEVYRNQKQLKKTFKMHMQTLTSLEIRRRSDFTWEPAEAFCQTVAVYELNSFKAGPPSTKCW